ncbi:hypothetical protein CsSME_00015295 [Camellia sinensis var. sinensis]
MQEEQDPKRQWRGNIARGRRAWRCFVKEELTKDLELVKEELAKDLECSQESKWKLRSETNSSKGTSERKGSI